MKTKTKEKRMKKLALIVAVIAVVMASAAIAKADVFVNGYIRGNGTYVAPHYRSSPDGNPYNNYSYWK